MYNNYMPVLQAKNLTKKFGPPAHSGLSLSGSKTDGFTAVNNISFDLEEGEILGILGPNGAGKTTIIQMLLGVLTPSAGQIIYFDKRLDKNRETILEEVNFSSSYTNLVWRLTVYENLTYISYLYKIQNRKKRIKEIVELFKLDDILNMEVSDLSAGQLTRVNLAKAFINFPKVLLLDEPTASLDPDVAKYIREFLLNERQKFKVSIILTSHNMSEVEEVCDRVIFINHGKIIADDTPDKLAKTINISHIELLIKDGLKRTIEYCEQNKIKYKLEGRYIVIDIQEYKIPDLLKQIMDLGVFYNEIAINKPNLEDYFIAVTQKNHETS